MTPGITSDMEWVEAKSIVATNKAPNWNYLAAEYNMNIYRGCSHGCIYCFTRGEFYKIPDFDRVRAKKDALRIIRDDLMRKTKPGVVNTGGMSDPYNPREAEFLLTRHALELLNAFSFGICVLTKSVLVTRDVDVLQDIKTHSPVSVNFSITASDDETAKKIEPHAAVSSERFRAINQLAKEGIFTGVLLDPVLPYITDNEENIREIVKMAKFHGASYIYASMGVTMEGIQRDYFFEQAETHYPGTAEKYRARFKEYYRCRSPKGTKLWDAFTDECEKQQIVYDMRTANRNVRNGYPL